MTEVIKLLWTNDKNVLVRKNSFFKPKQCKSSTLLVTSSHFYLLYSVLNQTFVNE